jgi:3-deoxy-D-manno-octulosonate 8-phosphate phosphatase (KDO 8-P phosphatase)
VTDNFEVEQRAGRVKLLLMDCDGVLTDGRITLFADGEEQKSFHTRDGQGLVLLHKAGIKTGIISGRTSSVVVKRARELNIEFVLQGVASKIAACEDLRKVLNLDLSEVGYVGDDLADIALMKRVGFSIAVADGVAEAKAAAHYTTTLPGGFGAVREVCELVLKAQGHWKALLERYLS